MSAPLDLKPIATPSSTTVDPGAPGRLAHRTYEDLRVAGLSDVDIMAFAGELLSLVASGVRSQPAQS